MRIGVDLGGTKIEAIALADHGEIVARKRVGTPRDYGPALEAIADLVHRMDAACGYPASVGIGIPGASSPATGLVKNANSVWLIGKPLARDLERMLGRPVRLANDANCFALSEAADGAAAGMDVVFGVILGTGVGGGIVVNGRWIEGPNQIAGEWGHNPLPWLRPEEFPGPPCYCGRFGCIEAFLSGPGLERDFAASSDRSLGSRAIVDAAASGDADAAAALDRYHDRLGRALASVANLLDPDVIVLGGGMSNLPDLARHTRAAVARYVFSDTFVTPVVPNVHGDSSGVRGAAWLWPIDRE